MYETPGARQPQRDSAPPWDPWERRPDGQGPPTGSQPPPAGHQPPPAGLQPAPERPPPVQHRLAPDRARERSRWHWLLLAAVLIPLAAPLYNRAQPQLLGLPFFYWCQFAFTGLAALVTGFVQLVTRKRRP